jgi:hypothetical protein
VAKRTAVFWDVLHDPFSVDRQFGTNLNHGSTGEIAMFRTKNIVSIVALSVALIAGHAGASTAGGEQAQAFKPFQGFTFQAGEKHAVGYFYDDEGFCKLVLTLSASANSDPRNTSQRRAMRRSCLPDSMAGIRTTGMPLSSAASRAP